MRVALWSVAESGPTRLDQGHTFAEADLEG